VDGVAAEVAKKIGVFFEDKNFDAGAGEEESEHHTGWAAPHDTAGGLFGLRRGNFRSHDSRLGRSLPQIEAHRSVRKT
jgi:hypothetical protein